MISVRAETRAFDKAMSDLIRKGGRDIHEETMRQAKLLALQVASNAPPKPKKTKGLSVSIPRIKATSWLKVVRRLVKPAYSMRVIDAMRAGDPDLLAGIARTTKRPDLLKNNSANRIIRSAKRDAVKALALLRQLFKGRDGGKTLRVYQGIEGDAMQHYYKLLDDMGKYGLDTISESEKVFLKNPIGREHKKIIAGYMPTIGTLKAGWVQAAMALPSKAGRKPPNWLLNKKQIGSGSVAMGGYSSIAILRNARGNAKGVNDRIEYVGKAVRLRTRKMVAGLKGAIAAMLAQKAKAMGQPIPSSLRGPSRKADEIEE